MPLLIIHRKLVTIEIDFSRVSYTSFLKQRLRISLMTYNCCQGVDMAWLYWISTLSLQCPQTFSYRVRQLGIHFHIQESAPIWRNTSNPFGALQTSSISHTLLQSELQVQFVLRNISKFAQIFLRIIKTLTVNITSLKKFEKMKIRWRWSDSHPEKLVFLVMSVWRQKR